MISPAIYPYIKRHPSHLVPSPVLPFRVERNGVKLDLTGIVDSGAMLSVLPYDVGSQFGVPWASLTSSTTIGGVAGGVPARFISFETTIASFPPITLIFAWAQSNTVPILLGHVQFFLEFEVCFFADNGTFQVRSNTP